MLSFCKPVSDKRRFLPHRRLHDGFTFTLFGTADALPLDEWEQAARHGSLFLETEYLRIVEHCAHTRMLCRYVLVYHRGVPCGVIYFQVVDFSAGVFGDLLSRQVENIRSRRMSVFERYIRANSNEVLLRLFTCGNNLASGEHGFVFTPNIGRKQAHELVLAVTDLIAREEKLRGTIAAILLKDFYKPLAATRTLETQKYARFSVEPNMVVDLPQNIGALDDYLALFSKKYRNRARAILKKSQPLERRELDAADVKKQEIPLYGLYLSVFEKAKFRLMQLPATYFSQVRETFPGEFFVTAYFIENEPVAFFSYFLMRDRSVEAHYIGINYALNETYELYQTILLDLVRTTIAHRRVRLNLGRTAAEIKSTIGAKPLDLQCYIKPQNPISRLIQRPFIAFLQPAPWTPRNPFKEEAKSPESVRER